MAKIIYTDKMDSLSKDQKEWVYNGLDCCVTLEVLQELLPQLDNTTRSTYEFSKELQAPIMEMSLRGLLVDERKRQEVLAGVKLKLTKIERNLNLILKEGYGVDINWRSPQQLMSFIYDFLGLKVIRKRNAQGRMAPTVNRDAIEKLSVYLPAEIICNHIISLRELKKKQEFLETEIDDDSIMRYNFNIAGTVTGRLSSSASDFGTGTNAQNVDRELRSIHVARKGMKYGNIDLEQADSRNLGAICWNLFLKNQGAAFAGSYLDACESGDLHSKVCQSAWTNLEWGDDAGRWRSIADTVAYRNDSYRDLAKKLGHGTNYYGQPPTMAKNAKLPQHMVVDFQSNYFRQFPCIPAYHKYIKESLKDMPVITTMLGRRRHFFGRQNDLETIKEAIAFEPQSLTADEIDYILLKIWRSNRVHLLVQVHDSIMFEYHEEEEAEIIPWALEQAKYTIQLAGGREFFVPVEAKVGWNWGDESNENPLGLIKWTGKDTRERTPTKIMG